VSDLSIQLKSSHAEKEAQLHTERANAEDTIARLKKDIIKCREESQDLQEFKAQKVWDYQLNPIIISLTRHISRAS
jgi:hypothetical protein